MFDVGPNLRWRLTTGLLSLLIVFAAEEKACPTLIGACAGQQSEADSPTDGGNQDRGAPGQKKAPPIQIGATIPDGLVPRALDQSAELSAERASLAALQLAAAGAPDATVPTAANSTTYPPLLSLWVVRLCDSADSAPPLPTFATVQLSPQTHWPIGHGITPTGPPIA